MKIDRIKIKIGPSDLSNIFWNTILENAFLKQKTFQAEFFKKIDSLEELRKESDKNTGSISSSTSWMIFSTTLFFQPKIIMEVGSFIGKSTLSMGIATDFYSENNECQIYCCDHSNKIHLPNYCKANINQFHKTSSTEMLNSIPNDIKFDLVHLDGWLQKEDFDTIKNHLHKKTIFVLDDFEGIEKGTVNYLNLVNNLIISRNSYRLIDPIKSEILNKFNLIEKTTTAILLPMEYINFSNQ